MRLKNCPVCGNNHGCKKGDEGLILCLRGLTENFISAIPGYPQRGYRYIKPLKQNMGGLWVDESAVSKDYTSDPFKYTPAKRTECSFEQRSDVVLDREYRKLLSQLELSQYHKNILTKRGVKDLAWAERVGFRSFVPRRPVANVATIPGVIDGLTVGNNGMWIPIQTPVGLMIGAQCAPKRKDLGKYTYITGGTRVRENQGVLISYAYAFPEFAAERKYPVAHLSITITHTTIETTVITVVTDAIGTPIKTASKVFKPFQNDSIAELNGLLLGLQLALTIGVKSLHISGVSDTVRQVLKSNENDSRSQALCYLINELLDQQFEYCFNYNKPIEGGVTEESLTLGESFLDTREVWFVDGTAKAWYTAHKHKKIVLGCPMANHASNLEDLTDYLDALKPEKCIHALDAGDVVNTSNVPATNYALQKALRKLNYQVLTAWWGQVEKPKKGEPGNDIDDLDTLDNVEYLTTSQFLDLHPDEIASNIEPSRFYKAGIQEVDEPYEYPRDIKYRQPSYFLEGYRTEMIRCLIEQKYRFIHDASFAGSGKSRDFSLLSPEFFGVEQILWVVDDPISLEYPDWAYYRGRDHGRMQREDGRFIAAKPGTPHDELSLQGNCIENEFSDHLTKSNVPPSADKICLDCPFQHTCKSDPNFYLKARSKAIKAPKLRLHPAALDVSMMKTSDGKKWDLDADLAPIRVIILDDVNYWIKSISIQSAEIKAFLQRHEDQLKFLPALRNALVTVRRLLSKRDANKNRVNLQHNDIINTFSNLSDLNQEQVDLLIEAEYNSIRDSFKAEEENHKQGIVSQDVTHPKAFIEDFIEAVTQKGHLNTYKGGLTIHLKNKRFFAAVNHPSVLAVIIADATAKTEHLEKWLQSEVQIPVIAQQLPDETARLNITQIVGLGDVGYTRSDRVVSEVEKVKAYIEENHKDYAFINTKKGQSESTEALSLTWLSTSRGSNAAKKAKGLVCIGTPRANLAALYAKYSLMTGVHPDETSTLTPYPVNYSNRKGNWVRVLKESADPAFAEFCHQEVTAELTQGFNRLRHARRAGEVLDIVFVSEYPLEVATRALTVSEFIEGYQAPTLKLRPNQARVNKSEIMEAVGILRNLKFRITQRALALLCEVTEGTIRCFFDKVGRDWKQFKSDCENAGTLDIHDVWENVVTLTDNSSENNTNNKTNTSLQKSSYLEPQGFQRFSKAPKMLLEPDETLTATEDPNPILFEFNFK
jgi:hypothetical protein